MAPEEALRRWLGLLDAAGTTDLHLKPGSPPKVRRKGVLDVVRGEPVLTRADVDGTAASLLASPGARACSLSIDGLGRFRVQSQRQRGSTLLVIRRIPDRVPSLAELGLPGAVAEFTEPERGLVLVGGPPRSGRRSTLASMLDHINRTRAVHLVSVEGPVEVLHRDRVASVSQIEVGTDAPTVADGVLAALGADADVVVVSELATAAAVEAVLGAVEEGALVLAGMEGDGAGDLLRAFLGLLAAPQREWARIALAGSLVGTLSQRLAARAGDTGRVAVVEVVRATGRVREALLDDGAIDGVASLAEVRFVDAVADLFERGALDLRGALAVTDDWTALHEAMRRRGLLAGSGDDVATVFPPSTRRVPGTQLLR